MSASSKEGLGDADGEISGVVMKLRAHMLHTCFYYYPNLKSAITLVCAQYGWMLMDWHHCFVPYSSMSGVADQGRARYSQVKPGTVR